MLALPLIDRKNVPAGVMQVLNKTAGIFDGDAEVLAVALAAQCAVALQQFRLTEALIEGETMRQELWMARVVQMNTRPAVVPSLPATIWTERRRRQASRAGKPSTSRCWTRVS